MRDRANEIECPCCGYPAHKTNIGKRVGAWNVRVSALEAEVARLRAAGENLVEQAVALSAAFTGVYNMANPTRLRAAVRQYQDALRGEGE